MEAFFEDHNEDLGSIKLFEQMLKNEDSCFFDVSTFEYIIEHYLEEGDLEKAYRATEMAVKQFPFSAELHVQMAGILNEQGKYNRALRALEKAESIQPNDYEVLMLKGVVLLKMNRFEDSLTTFEAALPTLDNKDDGYLHIGLVYQSWRKYDRAAEAYKKALEVNVSNESALFELAFCLEVLDQLEESLPYYQTFIDNDPYSAHAWYNIGTVYDKLGEYDKAAESYDYAVIIDDDFSSAHFNKGNSLLAQEKFKEAIPCFEKTLELEQNTDPESFYNIGFCFEKLADYEKGVLYYRKALGADQYYDEAWFGIGVCLEKMERWFEAAHAFQKAVDLDNNNQPYLMGLADAEYKIGNLVSSLQAYQLAAEVNPANILVWKQWSAILYEQGDYQKAFELMGNALDEFPDDPELNYISAAYLICEGNYKEALVYLENALILDFDKHAVLFEYFPDLEKQKALMKLIDQFRD